MAQRYCLNGSDRFLLIEDSDNTLQVAIFEEGPELKSTKFTPERWAQFVFTLSGIFENVKKPREQQLNVKFQRHLGGKWYVSLASGFKCVMFCQF
jgi:hypothetical protein